MRLIWSLKDIVEIAKERQKNKFDVCIAVSGSRGDGKCEIKGDKVLMHDGTFKNIENVKIGEKVISPQKDGSFIFSNIVGTHSHYEKEVYEVREKTRNKKVLYTCSGKHQIPALRRHSKRTSKDDSTPRIKYRRISNLPAEKLTKSYTSDSSLSSFSTTAFETSSVKKPSIEPYCLGVFLGDGHFTKDLGVTSNDIEIIKSFLEKYRIMSVQKKTNTTAKTYRFSVNGALANKLKSLGLRYKKSGNKFIPKEYINYSIKNKFQLLAGLIDTDGFISKNNQVTICTKSLQLAEDIKNLVFSLGGYSLIRNIYKNHQKRKEKKLYYDVSVQFKNPKVIPLKLKRKKDRLRTRLINPRNIAVECIKTKSQMVYGIELDSDSKWYVTNNYMVTHNSTFLYKFFSKFKSFRPWRHQIYSRNDVMKILEGSKFSCIFDDEAIRTGYKRNFFDQDQKLLIQMLNMYRDNFNVYGMAIPNFYSLDKDLRDLIRIHIHVIERGLAVLHISNEGTLYSDDSWDIKYNKKVEERWAIAKKKNPNYRPKYNKLTTFRGYIKFGDLTKRQREIYEEIKVTKRKAVYEEEMKKDHEDFYEVIINRLKKGEIGSKALQEICLVNKLRLSSVKNLINVKLKDSGEKERLAYFLDSHDKKFKKTNIPEKERFGYDDKIEVKEIF